MRRLLGLLRKDGRFYARTPYVAPLMNLCRTFGIGWDFTYPAHVHDLGQAFWEAYFKSSACSANMTILASRPSIVETSMSEHLARTVAAYALKAPWYLLRHRYKLVGGWEVVARKLF